MNAEKTINDDQSTPSQYSENIKQLVEVEQKIKNTDRLEREKQKIDRSLMQLAEESLLIKSRKIDFEESEKDFKPWRPSTNGSPGRH